MPDFWITDDNTATVEKIVRRLEGLPLSVELAAAWVRVMSVDQILRRLSDRFEFLTRGSRTVQPRQQTLKWSIDWSYDLCAPREQWLWAHLTIFAGSFDLEAVEGIFAREAGHDDLVDLVTSLVDKSVLIREAADADVRFRMLDTLQDYGRSLLLDKDWTALKRRHRDWYQQLMLSLRDNWIGPHQAVWMTRIDRDGPNVRSALEFSLADPESVGTGLCVASALYNYWLPRGRFSEGRYWLDRALAAAARTGGCAESEVIEALVVDALMAAYQRDISSATDLAEEVRRRAEQSPETGGQPLATYTLGFIAIVDGDLSRGAELLEHAIQSFRATNDILHLVSALCWFAYAIDVLGENNRAWAVYEEILDITDSRDEIIWRATAMTDYGWSLWRDGHLERGVELLEGALRLMRGLDDLYGCAWCFEEIAWTMVDHNPELAAELMGAADVQFTATGSPLTTFESMVPYRDACVDQARGALGSNRYRAAFQRGMALTIDDAIARALGEQSLESPPEPVIDEKVLTPRESQIAELVSQGLTNKAIAERLAISQRTVDGHVEHILDKLGFGSRTQIATWLITGAGGRPTPLGD